MEYGTCIQRHRTLVGVAVLELGKVRVRGLFHSFLLTPIMHMNHLEMNEWIH